MTEDLLGQHPCGGGRKRRLREPPDVRPQTLSDHARTRALDRLALDVDAGPAGRLSQQRERVPGRCPKTTPRSFAIRVSSLVRADVVSASAAP